MARLSHALGSDMSALRSLALALLMIAGCGTDEVGVPDADNDLAVALCNLDVPECTGNATCGAPCDGTTQHWCSNHACFEPTTCQCVVDHWLCHWGSGSCDMVPWPRDDLAASDLAATD
jgi:hypothetical protein